MCVSAKVTAENLYEQLKEYNEAEKRYKQIFASEYQQLLNERVISPGYPSNRLVTLAGYFGGDQKLTIRKHDRYCVVRYHQHEFVELIYVYNGGLRHFVEDETIEMKQGDLCVISPYTFHFDGVFDDSIAFYIIVERTHFCSLLQHYTSTILGRFAESISNGADYPKYAAIKTGDDPKIRSIITNMMVEAINRQTYFEKVLDSEFSELAYRLMRDFNENSQISERRCYKYNTVDMITRYIYENFSSVTTSELSQKFNYSGEYLNKMVKRNTGHTICRLIIILRLNYAEQLLKNSELTCSEIANIIGYQSHEYFYRLFKRETGMTPTEFREHGEYAAF
ncbi:MAG: AraC family transcriptional regulator [Eubacteriales bacterium]